MARAIPLNVGYRLADTLSVIHWWAAPSRRRAVAQNLRILGLQDPSAAVRDVFRNYGRTTFEFLRGPRVPELEVQFENIELLDAALARGKGVILAVAHTGNWTQVGVMLAERGIRCSAVADIQLHPRWTAELRKRQERDGIRILPPGIASWRLVPKLLARNELVGLLVDGDVFRGGVSLEVDGHRVRLPSGPAKLAMRTGATLLPAWAIRQENGSILFRFGPELSTDESTGNGVRETTRELLDALMEHLRRHPNQWMIFRPFFEPVAGQANMGEQT